jgi:hypothetical protein
MAGVTLQYKTSLDVSRLLAAQNDVLTKKSGLAGFFTFKAARISLRAFLN